ncbi:hypothetical protein HMPREF0290_1797 [Corynebacterium efficiens YS-314]|uniref:Secreted protein n=1 Tax=Corynebacterium efficiens (strain DSM 44549 / YS-314 / AJ 12310 / JCM 11189 / NBRC 100395) TaxID=196164 RepID=Q8FPL2_COREF|nr:hypothetical protein [Corynebacterium efficiens]EEW49556.1 hypothetical protein HMPREF0290_1797 [Corynebacterium efficiens YS-314]BAC18576.1 conserved hypothetical protein [Corynebacterium efficiens YS-314]
MKIFSRTSLVALGTAAAVAASAFTAPAFAEDEVNNGGETTTVVTSTEATTTSAAPTVTETATRTVTATPSTTQSGGSSDMDNVNDWIKIITAVIGALTTVLTFASNLDRFINR